ncbi:hypothetical protein NKH77_25630 [Streptomyces sp. M19]
MLKHVWREYGELSGLLTEWMGGVERRRNSPSWWAASWAWPRAGAAAVRRCGTS